MCIRDRYYMDGVQVYDITDTSNPVRVGYYDTYPDNGATFFGSAYEGCWGVYPFLPSGNIIASDITYGLFVLSSPYTVNASENDLAESQIAVYPNPATSQFSVRLPEAAREYRIGLYNMLGQQISAKVTTTQNQSLIVVPVNAVSAGTYIVKIKTTNGDMSRKIVVR